jgi:hypothetical protein
MIRRLEPVSAPKNRRSVSSPLQPAEAVICRNDPLDAERSRGLGSWAAWIALALVCVILLTSFSLAPLNHDQDTTERPVAVANATDSQNRSAELLELVQVHRQTVGPD